MYKNFINFVPEMKNKIFYNQNIKSSGNLKLVYGLLDSKKSIIKTQFNKEEQAMEQIKETIKREIDGIDDPKMLENLQKLIQEYIAYYS